MTLLPGHKSRLRRAPTPRPSLNEPIGSKSSSTKIRLVHIINDVSIGGAEMMLYKLLSQVNRERFDPIVVALRNRGQLHRRIEALDVPVYNVAMRLGIPTPTSGWRLIRLMRRLKPDLIQGWMYHGSLAAQVGGAFAGRSVPVVWNIRQSLNKLNYEKRATAAIIKFLAHLSKRPAKIIYNSRIAAAQHGAIGYEMQDSLVIPNGFMTSLFTPSQEARNSVRVELGIPDETLLIGRVSRYHPAKDHANFLHAAALLLRTHPDVQFVLCGDGVNWVNASLCRLIDDLKLTERVHLLDQRQDMPRLTAALDIATSSSCGAESFPNVIGEAMSCGVPCVATDVSDLLWIIGETGRVVPPRNAQALSSAMQELVELGAEGREELGRAARERVLKHFPLKDICSLYEALYEDVLDQHPRLTSSNVRYHEFAEHASNAAREEAVQSSSKARRSSMGHE
jgi:glycosyltransferase involved in cell wall biosynthesis